MSSKKWVLSNEPSKEFLAEHSELPTIVARLLWNRNLKTTEQIKRFLNPNYATDIHDPFLFKDMPVAVELIFDCLKNNKRIVVHGDYDADGVDAASILLSTLKKLGGTNLGVFLPHRETDGYGINLKTVDLLKSQDTHVIITCDCGVSNTPEIEKARGLGMHVIVTDHHAIPAVIPPADAIIHPLIPGETYPDKTLSGGGVAFKLAQALLATHHKTHEKLQDGETHEAFEKWLLDRVAISSVADMVPLLGETRTLVYYGLTVLNKTRNLGLRALLTNAGLLDENGKAKKIFDPITIGFQIAPRINAAGRMDHANVAFELLMAETPEAAKNLADQLNQNNLDRQKLTEKYVTEARYQITKTEQENNPILFVFGESWTTGILGLIASRIKEEFAKPVFAMGLNDGNIVGSGRSVAGFNLIKAMQETPEVFLKFGGHPQACGFTLKSRETLHEFKEKLLAKAVVGTKDIDLTPQIVIEAEVDLDEVNWKLYEYLEKFEPFGVQNEEPIYAAKNLTVVSVDPVGQDGKHLRLAVKHNSHLVKKTIAFGFGNVERHPDNWKALKPGEKIDLAFTIGVNEWNGNRELQLQVRDIKKSTV